MSKIKIMHLLQSDRFSGAENVVCQIMEMFRGNEDYEMIYVSPDGPISSSLKERNIPFYGLERLDYKNVRLAIKEINPNIIHAHDVSAGLFATLAAKKNIKIILQGGIYIMKKKPTILQALTPIIWFIDSWQFVSHISFGFQIHHIKVISLKII